ncbi:hypothetical protein [Limimaricola hongkongensis]|uniref:Uncharacterized protein n=1 Tax=Limimaricola hongkongensis DSM 17492 TaxID=1122180 RepID=A0A017HDW2_9RHOB|nr:hypothetical protein [Limimaricola hongkongensis]EYD72697.1 hypothetical protein Lokhon_01498 [Limimaricola hongkongensis DSM 17492]
MLNRIMTIVALAVFLGFLGILVWHIPRFDLGAVLAVTVALVLWDVFTTSFDA